MKNKNKNNSKGFTLIEMLVVIGLIAMLATAVLVAVNPGRQFKFAHDTERKAHLATLLNAIGQNMAENGGKFFCKGASLEFPSNASIISSVSGSSSEPSFDIAPCIVPTYMSKMPFDPTQSGAYFDSVTDYDTKYKIYSDGTTGQIFLSSISEIDPENEIKVSR